MGIPYLDRALSRTVSSAGVVLDGVLRAYESLADHRHTLPSEQIPSPSRTKTVHLIRGMTHFAPSHAFMATFKSLGHTPKLFTYEPEHERNRFRQWRENSVDVLAHFINQPSDLGPDPVFLGHSAGGFVVYILAALADGANPEKILEVLKPAAPLASVLTVQNLSILGRKLKQTNAQFVVLGTPIHGIRLTKLGKAFDWLLRQTTIPNFLSSITHETIQNVYKTIGKDPEKVIDTFFVSKTPPNTTSKNPLSWLVQELLRHGYKICSPFLDHEEENDGLVPVSTAQPRSDEGRKKTKWIRFDHLKMFDLAGAAFEVGGHLFFTGESEISLQ